MRGNLQLLVMRISVIAKLKKSALNEAIPDELAVFPGFLDLKNKLIDIEKTIGIGTEKLFYSKKKTPTFCCPSDMPVLNSSSSLSLCVLWPGEG